MFCRTCSKHNKKNSMTEGTSNLRASTFNRHTERRDHKEAIITDKVQSKNLVYMVDCKTVRIFAYSSTRSSQTKGLE